MTVRWVTRDQAGLQPPNLARLSRHDPHDRRWGVTKHHTAGATPHVPLDSFRIWRELQASAMSGNNVNHTRYGDIEYNVGFDDFGQILVGRDSQWVGAHAASANNVANRMTFGAAYLGRATRRCRPSTRSTPTCTSRPCRSEHAAITLGHKDWSRWGGIITDCPGLALELSRP